MLLIHFFCYILVNKSDFSCPAPTRFSPPGQRGPIADCVPLNPLSSRMRAYNGKVYCVFMLLHCRLFDLPLPCIYMYTIIVY